MVTDFEIRRNPVTNEISEYVAFRQAVPKRVVQEIEPLYAQMLEIEKDHGMEASVEYLTSFLEEKRMNYDQYIEQLAKPTGLAAALFDKMKKMFG